MIWAAIVAALQPLALVVGAALGYPPTGAAMLATGAALALLWLDYNGIRT